MTSTNRINRSQASLTLTLMQKFAQRSKFDAQESTAFWLNLNLTYVQLHVVDYRALTTVVMIFAKCLQPTRVQDIVVSLAVACMHAAQAVSVSHAGAETVSLNDSITEINYREPSPLNF